MSSINVASAAGHSFQDFCFNMPPEKLAGNHTCLMDFVMTWVESGEGVRVCNGDFHAYTIALVGIIDRWIERPEVTDYALNAEDPEADLQIAERRVDSIFGERGHAHRAFDRYWFESVVFARLNPDLKPFYL